MARNKLFLGILILISVFLSFSVAAADAVVFSENFESGLGDWEVDNGVWEEGLPTVGPTVAHSGTQCAGTVLSGNYPGYTDSRIISPRIRLPEISGDEEIHLRFWQWFSYSSYDAGYVQIKVQEV